VSSKSAEPGAGWRGYALVAPALAVIAVFFVLPLALSAVLAFRAKDGSFTLEHFAKSWDLYRTDLWFTIWIVVLSTVLIGLVAILIAGYLTLGENPRAVAILRWLYRWPLFIPFIVTGQIMRTFLAKNGMLNHVLIGSGLIEPQHIEAARNLGAPRWRVLLDIVLPQVRGTLLVGLVLSFVTMLSVLSVPLMINPNSPTMITVDVAYRINTHGDYAVANALCLMSLVVAAFGAWFYLRQSSRALAK
jgi:putative spermidine/putrescine transport system permease protein